MELWIIISAGIAIGALGAVVWKSDRELREKTRRLEVAESRLEAVFGQGGEGTASPAGKNDKLGELESEISRLTEERSKLLEQIESLRRHQGTFERTSHQAESLSAELSQNIAALRSENSELRNRIAELERDKNGHQEKVFLLQDDQAKIPELEQRIAELQQDKDDIFRQVKDLEKEKETNLQRIRALEGLETKLVDLEDRIAGLSAENIKLSRQFSELHLYMRDKIKLQLDGLQELYQNLQSNQH